MRTVFQDSSLPRDGRVLVRKVAKAFDQFTFESAQKTLQLATISTKLKEKSVTKRTRVRVDSNTTFASIKEIKEAQDRAAKLQEEWDRRDRAKEAQLASEAIMKMNFQSLCSEWHVNDVVGVVDTE